jgi:hydroxyethylthiazole kinase-like sugar kinase family protein
MRARKLIGAGFMLATTLAAFAAFSQENLDEFEPAVDTSAISEDMADEMADLEPGVDTSAEPADAPEPEAALAEDVERQYSSSGVMDVIELGRTEITGNQELPTVMYIVPWQKAEPGELTGKPVNSLIDEVLAPLDREEFTRQVDFYGDLYGEEQE